MGKAGKILVISGVAALASALFAKYAVDKAKRAVANLDFSISFNRIHGLVGDGIARFLNPTIRVIVDLTVKNFSGFELEASRIFTRLEVKAPGSPDWEIIATQDGYKDLKVADGKTQKQELAVDVKGFSGITSLVKKGTACRSVTKYEFKGIELEYVKDLDISGPLSIYWNKIKSSIPSLRGVGSIASLAA